MIYLYLWDVGYSENKTTNSQKERFKQLEEEIKKLKAFSLSRFS
jgi:hypothetical protein